MRRLLALCACFVFLTALSAAEDFPSPAPVVEPTEAVTPAATPTMAPAEPATEAAPVVAATGEPSPPPVFREVSIANELIRVVVTTQRAGIVRYELLNEKPVVLPPALRERANQATRPPLDQPVPLLDNFIGSTSNPHWNLHNVLDFATESAANVDNTNHIPWEIVTADASTATLRLRLPERGLQIEMIYTVIPGRPSVGVEMVLTNTSQEEQLLMPRLDPALGGIFQDYPPAESYYLCGFKHQDGSIENLGVPEVGKSQLVPLEGVDYIGLKSRFFAALWQQDWSAAAPTPEQAVPAQGGLSGSAAVVEQVDAAAAATRSGSGVLFGLQRLGDNGPMVALRVDLPSAQLAAGANARYRWQITGSSMSKDALARLTEAEQRVKYTDGYYRFFKVLANALAFCLDMIAIVVRNYGVALIILTCLIKLALHRTTFKQQASLLKMSKLAPEIKLLQERYKTDRQQLGLKTMELYKKHGVNPLGGCLPILIQMPMFMALYQVFTHSADFRNSGFLWISDLTLSDAMWGIDNPWLHWLTINPLALIYIGVTLWMSFQHKIPEGADPQQAQMQKMMRWLPLIFGVIFYHMPTGLVLYFTVNAILSTIEIKMVKRKLGMS